MPPVFRYFELVDDDASRYAFWEILIDGPTLELRQGPVGTAGTREVETCASVAAARREYALRIEAQLAAGYRECADRRLDTRTRALEDAIEADPDDVAAYMVYADWIQTLGDPRGALIVAQIAAAESKDAAARATAYLAQHAALFLGPLAEHVGYDGAAVEPTWRNGFIRAARIPVMDRYDPPPWRALAMLLDHPSARWLGELTLETVDATSGLQLLVDELATRTCTHLRTLVLGEVGEFRETDPEEWEPYWRRPGTTLTRLWKAVPKVRHVVIKGDQEQLGTLALEDLEHLELHTRIVRYSDVLAIANCACPKLERLELRCRWPQSTDLPSTLQPIFASPLVRRLDHLAITGITATDGVCAQLATVRRPSLRTLDLSHGNLTDDGATVLAGASLELDMLDVSGNPALTPHGVAALEQIAKLVIR